MNSNDRDADRPVFTSHQRATIEAATARIIPTDRDPGALEARVIEYIERTLTSSDTQASPEPSRRTCPEPSRRTCPEPSRRTCPEPSRRIRQLYLDGVQDLDNLARDQFGAETFCSLQPRQQDQILTALEEKGSRFFSLLIEHTMEGFYGDPRHGGNRNRVGWTVLGFPGPSYPEGYQPPLGWYDANVPDDFVPKKK